ncbi:preprotein translocase subunit TatA [Acinetobacter sp. TGL-Y2]|uniref:Sec-independent protein translocase subunit TatA n=1 Tax=Acinetobacter sp. TGL-Y2 TaxID=1407071 RepID=UPI0007A66058|nr:Sec-independent protein translocase subunit TatA [Acinetobacter sp. TGL-Y2]AMW77837.1 preprotein translocase subunit TatA [Acinetobacter sp. TGL-Y2]
MAGLSIWHVLIFAIVVLLLFGTSKLKNLGKDVGGAVKDFKKSIKDEDELNASISGSMSEPRTIEHQNKHDLNTTAKH